MTPHPPGDTTGPVTLGALVAEGVHALAAAGVSAPRRDARLLIAVALGLPESTLFADPTRAVAGPPVAAAQALIARRAAREPVSRILGRREFWSLEFHLGPATLDPRRDSETVVDAALAATAGQAVGRVLDLGTGTGCLLLAVLSERPGYHGVGVDLSAEAAAMARHNAARLGLTARTHFVAGDWTGPIDATFDIVLCNPPYIAEPELDHLEPEVAAFDPRRALAGGPDGLSAYRRLSSELHRVLGRTGVALFEIGDGQAAAVGRIFQDAGFAVGPIAADLAGRARCVAVRNCAASTGSGKKWVGLSPVPD